MSKDPKYLEDSTGPNDPLQVFTIPLFGTVWDEWNQLLYIPDPQDLPVIVTFEEYDRTVGYIMQGEYGSAIFSVLNMLRAFELQYRRHVVYFSHLRSVLETMKTLSKESVFVHAMYKATDGVRDPNDQTPSGQ